jgi:hypothetical protein
MRAILACVLLVAACGSSQPGADASALPPQDAVATDDRSPTPDAAFDASPDDGSAADAAVGDVAADATAGRAPDLASPSDLAQEGSAASLTPTGLVFSFLPIDSLRGSVRGIDAEKGLCVDVVWDYSGRARGRHCDELGPRFPYIFIARDNCDGVHYQGNTEVLASRGCIDFASFGAASMNRVDVVLDVSGPLFTGTINLRGP